MSFFSSPDPAIVDAYKKLLVPVDLRSDNPWNLPDWKKIKNYPDVDCTSELQWRWEFLRRDTHYRNLWLQYQRNQALWDGIHPDGSSIQGLVAKNFSMFNLMNPRNEFNIFVEQEMWSAKPFDIWCDGISSEKFIGDALHRGHVIISVDPRAVAGRVRATAREQTTSGKSKPRHEMSERIWDEICKHIDTTHRSPLGYLSASIDDDVPSIEEGDFVGRATKVRARSQKPPRDSTRVEVSYYPKYLQILDAKTEFDRGTKEKLWTHVIAELAFTKTNQVLDYNAARHRLNSARRAQMTFVHDFHKCH